MKQSMRSRIYALSRFTMISALLVAVLVIVASRLSEKSEPASVGANSPIHSGYSALTDTTQQTSVSPSQPITAPASSTTAEPADRAPVEVPATPEPTPDVSHRIGVLAGHWGFDTGAVCNGLREVDITVDIAQRVATQLRSLGYQVDLLQEQHPDRPHPPLQNYMAAAFVSVHVDSCVPGASGFKVSRWAFSQMPEVENRLVQCLYKEYSAVTGIPRHDNSITIDMWNYYAFREIGKPTPGAIIELGFMTGDRWLLVQQPDLAAQGIVNGLLCFLNGATN